MLFAKKTITMAMISLFFLAGCASNPKEVEADVTLLMDTMKSDPSRMEAFCKGGREGGEDLLKPVLMDLAKADKFKSGMTSYRTIGETAGNRLGDLC